MRHLFIPPLLLLSSLAEAEVPKASFLYHGFELSPQAPAAVQRGLLHIYSATPFRGVGLGLTIKQKLDQAESPPPPPIDDYIDPKSPEGAFKLFGYLPSPPKRPKVAVKPLGTEVAIPILGDSLAPYRDTGSYAALSNCFECHAGVVGGQVVSGVMNAHLDQGQKALVLAQILQKKDLLLAANQADQDAGVPMAEGDGLLLNNFVNHVGMNLLKTYPFSKTKGDNLGPMAVWRTIARYQDGAFRVAPFGQLTPMDQVLDQRPLPTVDANPWWHYKYKSTIYRYGDATPDKASHFSFTFSMPHEAAGEVRGEQVSALRDVLSYVRQVSSPIYPRPLSPLAVHLGSKLFHGEKALADGSKLTCAGCHGSYEKTLTGYQLDYPDRGVMDVGTDGAYSEFLRTTALEITKVQKRALQEDIERLYPEEPSYQPDWEIPQGAGYQPPPLDGVWASAPYFHNGSVPTLEGVLNSKSRPRVWQRSGNPYHYDYRDGGLKVKALTSEDFQRLANAAKTSEHPFTERVQAFRRVYHTGEFGKGNGGHTFGDAMTQRERRLVIAFLKSLSGPFIKPKP